MRQQPALRVAEALATGLAFAGLLCWLTTCLVGSFRPQGLVSPYWSAVPGLRTDTTGIAAFVIAAVCLPGSEYLRLRRRAAHRAQPAGPVMDDGLSAQPSVTVILITQAIALAVAILATPLVGYLSVNAVTHPATLFMQATHVLPWPSEGTLRVLALSLCFCSVSTLRFLSSGRPAHRPTSSARTPSPNVR